MSQLFSIEIIGASWQQVCIAVVALSVLLLDPINRTVTSQYRSVFIGISATELAGQDAVAEVLERVELRVENMMIGKEDIVFDLVSVRWKAEICRVV